MKRHQALHGVHSCGDVGSDVAKGWQEPHFTMRLLPLVHGKESRSGPRRRSLFRSGIRNAGRSDIDASRRTRLARPDPEFAVLVSHPSFGPPFPEKLIFDPTASRHVGPALGRRAAGHSRGGVRPSSPESGSSPPLPVNSTPGPETQHRFLKKDGYSRLLGCCSMLATTAGAAAHSDCLWAARLSAASMSGATEAARPPAWWAEPQRSAMTPAAWPRGPRDPPRPPRNRIVPSVRGRAGCPGAEVSAAW